MNACEAAFKYGELVGALVALGTLMSVLAVVSILMVIKWSLE